jgi:exodeoxyribonuclease V alpha subunit
MSSRRSSHHATSADTGTLPLFPDDEPAIAPGGVNEADESSVFALPDGLAPPLDTSELLAELQRWVEAGWLRRLDLALARFIAEQAEATAPAVLLAVALLAQMEGRGHTCLHLAGLLSERERSALLAWPPEALAALDALLLRLPAELLAVPATALIAWDALLQRSAAVDAGGQAAHGCAPLVWDAGRLYLRRHWHDEQRVAAAVLQRSRWDGMASAGVFDTAPDPALVRVWLDRLFGPLPASSGAPAAATTDLQSLDWQRLACAVALRGQLALITGGPGTGKTYTVARLLALLQALHMASPGGAERPLRIALAAPTGKAAARLKQAIEQALDDLRGRLGDALDLAALGRSLGAARTLHSLLGARPDTRRLQHNARHPLDVDLLVVDEASMVHLEMMAALLDALPDSARLVLLGDKDQLASVEAGAVLGDLCRDADAGHYQPATREALLALTGECVPDALLDAAGTALAQQTVMLRRSRRFAGPIGALAQAVNAGDAAAAWRVLRPGEPVRRDRVAEGAAAVASGTESGASVQAQVNVSPHAVVELALHGRAGASGGYADYARLLAQRPLTPSTDDGLAAHTTAHADWVRRVLRAFERFRVLAALREGDWGVSGLNRSIEQALVSARLLRRSGEWYEGRPVMVTRNDPATGVHNGDVGLALRPAGGGALRVWFLDGEQLRSVLASRLAQVETAFAMTVHKSQGSEFEHTVLVLPQEASAVLTRELVYTGITRARQAFTLVAPEPTVFNAALARRTVRASGLPSLLNSAPTNT